MTGLQISSAACPPLLLTANSSLPDVLLLLSSLFVAALAIINLRFFASSLTFSGTSLAGGDFFLFFVSTVFVPKGVERGGSSASMDEDLDASAILLFELAVVVTLDSLILLPLNAPSPVVLLRFPSDESVPKPSASSIEKLAIMP